MSATIPPEQYGDNVSCFGFLTKDKTFQPHIKQKNFTTSIDYPENNRPQFNLYVSDTQYHQVFATPQLIKVKFDLSPPFDAAEGLSGLLFNWQINKCQLIVMDKDIDSMYFQFFHVLFTVFHCNF